MKISAAILILCFLAIVGVGAFFMGGDMAEHESCLATAINGFSCPTESIVGETFFHMNAARALTAFLLIAPFLLFAFFVTRIKTQAAPQMMRIAVLRGNRISRIVPQASNLIRWRALHETSPTEE